VAKKIDDAMSPEWIARQLHSHAMPFSAVHPDMIDKVVLLSAETLIGFNEIPKKFHTKQAEAIAAKSLAQTYNLIEGESYYDVAKQLIARGNGLGWMHQEYIDTPLILIALDQRDDLFRNCLSWLINKARFMIDEQVLDFIAGNGFNSIEKLVDSGFSIHEFSEFTLHDVLIDDPLNSSALFKNGRSEIVSKAIKNGFWPVPGAEKFPKRPKTLKDCIDTRMTTASESTVQIGWLNSYIANHPLASVAKLMNTEARRNVLLEIFPSDQLIGLFKDDKKFNGKLLESTLGL
jgi:hypothetical protein